MGRSLAGLVVLLVLVAVVWAEPGDRANPPQPPTAVQRNGGDVKPSEPAQAGSVKTTAPSRERSGFTAMPRGDVRRAVELDGKAAMVVIRFAIVQATAKSETERPAAAADAGQGGAKTTAGAGIVAMPSSSLFDVAKVRAELDGAALDLRGSDRQIGARLAAAANQVRWEIVERGQLTTLDGQSAYVQLGRREPRITAVQVTHLGRSNVMTVENVGTIATFMPRVHDRQRVSLQCNIEKSQLGPVEEGAIISELSGGEKVRAPQTETISLCTTVTVKSGEAVVLAGMHSYSQSQRKELLVLVSAELLDSR